MTDDNEGADSTDVETYEVDVLQGAIDDTEMIDWITRSLGDHSIDVRDVRPATTADRVTGLDPEQFLREETAGAEVDHPDPELVVQAARVASLIRSTMYDQAATESERLASMVWEER